MSSKHEQIHGFPKICILCNFGSFDIKMSISIEYNEFPSILKTNNFDCGLMNISDCNVCKLFSDKDNLKSKN